MTNEEIVPAKIPEVPDDLESDEGQTPGWYIQLVDAIERLYQNDLDLNERIKALEEKLDTSV